jgi:hypothetical protein
LTVTAVRGRGRPPIGDRLECRFPPGQRAEIDGLAERWGVKAPEVVRRLVELGLSALRHDPPAK